MPSLPVAASARLPALRLPGVLAEIAEATSAATAQKVAAAVGGTRVYIPANPREDHWLSKLVGFDNARAIGAALAPARGGLDILIPMGSASKLARWRSMHALIDKGLPKREIARAVGCHERVVQRHRNQSVKTAAAVLAQGDLFE